jgi:aspartate racemase
LPVANFFADPSCAIIGLETIISGIDNHSLRSCDAVILACNTAHILAEHIVRRTGIKLHSLIEQVEKDIKLRNITKLGVVASPVTIKKKLFNIAGVELIAPTNAEQNQLERIIGEIIDGKNPVDATAEIESVIENLFSRGAQSVVLGCTELELSLRNNMDSKLIRPLNSSVGAIFAKLVYN